MNIKGNDIASKGLSGPVPDNGTDVHGNGKVELRKYPYPYRAMLAICSDLDETPDDRVYFETSAYLNSRNSTALGTGLGLEVGNTIYFEMSPGQFSYWNANDAGRERLHALIRSGHVDCLHSFGDLATTRRHAEKSLEQLSRHGCRIEVWVDHGVAPTNFGADIMRGTGDLPGAEAYHADLSVSFGIKYVWRGRVTSVAGQGVPRSLSGMFRPEHPCLSAKTLAKEWAKGVISRCGSEKYSLHGRNDLFREVRLRSGHNAIEFIRSNPHRGGVSCGETGDGIAEVLGEDLFRRLREREGCCILYTHLGKTKCPDGLLGEDAKAAFRSLAQECSEGRLLVATTRRLLGYIRAREAVVFSAERRNGELRIDASTVTRPSFPPIPPEDLQGVTWYVSSTGRVRLFLDGKETDDLRINPPDHTGRASVSVPWMTLEYPDI